MTPVLYFLHLNTLDIILLIVNISAADDAFYKYFFVVIWRLNLTWKNVNFQQFLLLLRWLKEGKTKAKNGFTSICYLYTL